MSAFSISHSVAKLLNDQTKFDPEMIHASLNFWFIDHEKIRCPFPDHMRNKLPDIAILKFIQWSDKLTPEAKKEINDEILVEKFEELLFSEGHKFAETEDEKITIKYPFLVRTGDTVMDKNEDSIVTSRTVRKDGDNMFLDVTLMNQPTRNGWATSFELPEY